MYSHESPLLCYIRTFYSLRVVPSQRGYINKTRHNDTDALTDVQRRTATDEPPWNNQERQLLGWRGWGLGLKHFLLDGNALFSKQIQTLT